jgi:ribosomal protein L37AE/L43A
MTKENYWLGSCSICFRDIRVNNEKMVIHGYWRDGLCEGNAVNNPCYGYDCVPYQLDGSIDVMKSYISILEDKLDRIMCEKDELDPCPTKIEDEGCWGWTYDENNKYVNKYKLHPNHKEITKNNILWKKHKELEEQIDVLQNGMSYANIYGINQYNEKISEWKKDELVEVDQIPASVKTSHKCIVCGWELNGQKSTSSIIDGIWFSCKKCGMYEVHTKYDMETIIGSKISEDEYSIKGSKSMGKAKTKKAERILIAAKLKELRGY